MTFTYWIFSQRSVYEFKDYTIKTDITGSEISKNKKVLHRDKPILDFDIADIDGDGIYEMALINKKLLGKGGVVKILSLKNEPEVLYEEDLSEIKPFKIELGDFTGDGISEIAIGIVKKTPHHKIMEKRCFTYNLDFKEKRLIAKFRISKFARPYDDFKLFDIDEDGICEIITIERNEDKSKRIASYTWNGFGFNLVYKSDNYKNLKLFDKDGELKVDGRKVCLEENNIKVGE
ncbi:Hypothetical protein ING2D1G_1398 [Peptoniphilus sp. ING2-D1G]|nr:Hypothetical protein ING2D1G_1398 [Peptoniphilus sp. ING2-D1G]